MIFWRFLSLLILAQFLNQNLFASPSWRSAERRWLNSLQLPPAGEVLILQTGFGNSYTIVTEKRVYILEYSESHDQGSYDYPLRLTDTTQFNQLFGEALKRDPNEATKLLFGKFKSLEVLRASYIPLKSIRDGMNEIKKMKVGAVPLQFNPADAFENLASKKVVYLHFDPTSMVGRYSIYMTAIAYWASLAITSNAVNGGMFLNPHRSRLVGLGLFGIGIIIGFLNDGVMTAYERIHPWMLMPKRRTKVRTASAIATGVTCAALIRSLQ